MSRSLPLLVCALFGLVSASGTALAGPELPPEIPPDGPLFKYHCDEVDPICDACELLPPIGGGAVGWAIECVQR